MIVLRALLGVAALTAGAWALSSHRRRFPWRVVSFSLGLQIAIAGLILGTGSGRSIFEGAADFFRALIERAAPGANLVFGPLANTRAMDGVFGEGAGYIFATTASGLLAIIFFASLMAVLYHVGAMQLVIWVAARIMKWTLGVSGAEATAMAANVFAGMTEAPLVVRPYIKGMTESELNALMVGGFATIAGSVLALYMGFVGPHLAPHLLTASVMSAPAAFLVAKVMVPETEVSTTAGSIPLVVERSATNLVDAASTGAREGLELALNVAAMLIAFMALVNLVDWPLGALGEAMGVEGGLSLARVFGWAFAPVAWLLGVDGWHDSQLVGSLLGTKLAINEFIAYADLSGILRGGAAEGGFQDPRSAAIVTYALCGFANFASIGIQIGGISPLAPARRGDLSRLAPRAMLGGALASWMTATVAGMFL